MKYELNIKEYPEKIEFNLWLHNTVTSQSESVSRWVVQMQDKAIREKLIKAGWTPPPDKEKPLAES